MAAAAAAAAARLTVAVDGPAASGKGTLARALAAHFGLAHLDTGGLYRLLGLAAARQGVDLADEARLADLCRHVSLELLDDPAIRCAGALGK
jgi:cytidylate kinase